MDNSIYLANIDSRRDSVDEGLREMTRDLCLSFKHLGGKPVTFDSKSPKIYAWFFDLKSYNNVGKIKRETCAAYTKISEIAWGTGNRAGMIKVTGEAETVNAKVVAYINPTTPFNGNGIILTPELVGQLLRHLRVVAVQKLIDGYVEETKIQIKNGTSTALHLFRDQEVNSFDNREIARGYVRLGLLDYAEMNCFTDKYGGVKLDMSWWDMEPELGHDQTEILSKVCGRLFKWYKQPAPENDNLEDVTKKF